MANRSMFKLQIAQLEGCIKPHVKLATAIPPTPVSLTYTFLNLLL